MPDSAATPTVTPIGADSWHVALARRLIQAALAAPKDHLTDVASWHAHVPFGYALMGIHRPRLVVELGVHKGDSFLTFCHGLNDNGLRSTAIGIDTWRGDAHAGYYDGEAILAELRKKLQRHFKDTAKLLQKTFDDALNDVADDSVDLLHIDGLHTYEAVRHDFEAWSPKLSRRGIVLFHDTNVRTADFGVWKLWAELASGRESFEFPYGNGLGVLVVGTDIGEEVHALLAMLRANLAPSGTPVFALLEQIGTGLENRALWRFANTELERTKTRYVNDIERANAEIRRERTAANAEIARLSTEFEREREVARGEIARLNAELERERSAAEAEIARLNTEIVRIRIEADAEFKRLSSEGLEYRAAAATEVSRLQATYEQERQALIKQLESERQLRAQAAETIKRHKIKFKTALAERDYYRDLVRRQPLEFSQERESAVRAITELSEERKRLEAHVETLKAGESQLRQRIAELESQIATRNEEIARLGARISELERRPLVRIPSLSPLRESGRRLRHSARHNARLAGRRVIAALPLTPNTKVRIKLLLLSVIGPFFGLTRGSKQLDRTLAHESERYRRLAASARGLPNNVPKRSVSIIIPVYNQLPYTLACLESVHENTTDIEHEVIVVDDCSTDGTSAALLPRLDIIYHRNERNLGFIGSCNAGASIAGMNYVCFLNNDTKVKPGWLSALVNTFELHENVGLAGSKLVFPDGRLQEAGGLIWNDGSGWNWGRLQDPSSPRFNYARMADYCSGASILLPTALFRALGGFDPHYSPAYGEDSDIAFKVRSLGLSTIYQPLSEITHFEGVSSGTDTTKGVKKHQVVNAEKLARRWAPVLKHQGENGRNANIVADRGVAGRVLVLDQITPEPDRDAGSITALELMRALRDLGQKVTFVPCSNFCYLPPYSDMLAALGIESVLLPWVGSFRAHMQEYGPSYDAVLIFRPQTWYDHISDVRTYAPQARIIYHASDLHFLREEREAQISGKKPANGRLSQSRNAELDLISGADLCIVHSSAEQQLLAELRPNSKVTCFPWIYEARGEGEPFERRRNVVYLGSYGHPPNIDAVEHYVRDIHPLVVDRLPPDCVFVAAGSSPPPSLQALVGPQVKVPGYIEDLSPVLFSSRVMVAPLRYGAGIKGKILTSMAHGLPVVTTSIGAEGMQLIDGQHVLIADTPEAFAEATSRLYSDGALWQRLQRGGLDYVQQMTSREAGLRTVSELLATLEIPRIARMLPHVDAGGSTAFGSRLEVADISSLLRAGARYLTGAVTLVAVPNEVPLPRTDWPEGITFTHVNSLKERLARGDRFVVILDSCAVSDIDRLGRVLREVLDDTMEAVIVFAPPRLVVEGGQYKVISAFGERQVQQNMRRPVHEVWAAHFDIDGRTTEWIADTQLTGFPSLFFLRSTPRQERQN